VDVYEALAASPNARPVPPLINWPQISDELTQVSERSYLLQGTTAQILETAQERGQRELNKALNVSEKHDSGRPNRATHNETPNCINSPRGWHFFRRGWSGSWSSRWRRSHCHFILACAASTCFRAPRFVGLGNYADLMHDGVFWQATGNTFYYTLMALPAALIVSLGLAMLLTVEIPGRAVWRTIIFIPSPGAHRPRPRCCGCGCSTADWG